MFLQEGPSFVFARTNTVLESLVTKEGVDSTKQGF